jgi:folate-binding protein YgfZ
MPFFTPLPYRALVAVRGEDRISFLQGLVSNNMARVEAGQAVWAAFLTPQGKFLHEFFAVPHGDEVLLECERARRDDLITHLSRYKLRAKVSLAVEDSLIAGANWGGTAGPVRAEGAGVIYGDPRLESAGSRWALPADQVNSIAQAGLSRATLEAYDAHRFDLGLPDGSRDMEIEKALLLENGFEELHGVDFKKGCYIGQELTARTHYRALIKKRLMPVIIEGDALDPGAMITTADGTEAGELKSNGGGKGLALLRLDKIGGVLKVGESRIAARPPTWMRISV